MQTPRFPISHSLLAIAIASAVSLAAPAFGQERLSGKPTKEQILNALTPQQAAGPAFRTRGLSLGAGDTAKAEPEAPAQTSAGTGSGGAPAAAPVAAPARAKAAAAAPAAATAARSLDLEIPFEFNSARLTQDGKDVLDQLGEALKSDQLSGAKAIILEGHTDAKGNDAYNKELSLKRAQSVRAFLAIKHSIPSSKLRAVGKGSAELADPKNPQDAVNRRVRIIVDG